MKKPIAQKYLEFIGTVLIGAAMGIIPWFLHTPSSSYPHRFKVGDCVLVAGQSLKVIEIGTYDYLVIDRHLNRYVTRPFYKFDEASPIIDCFEEIDLRKH